jgi:RNAse (barnase) inhibitor barstar
MTTPLSRLLADSSRAGFYSLSPPRHAALKRAVKQLGYRLFISDLSPCRSQTAVLAKLGQDCAFPAFYGHNLDALYDILSDPAGLPPSPAHILLLLGLDSLRQAELDNFDELTAVFAAACAVRRPEGRPGDCPLWILIDTPVYSTFSLPSR